MRYFEEEEEIPGQRVYLLWAAFPSQALLRGGTHKKTLNCYVLLGVLKSKKGGGSPAPFLFLPSNFNVNSSSLFAWTSAESSYGRLIFPSVLGWAKDWESVAAITSSRARSSRALSF